jgi:5-methyltetrahydropteroyltriglutamate--homocysteine methyltransferase
LDAALRQARKALRDGEIDGAAYEERVNEYMRYAVDIQEKLGLDVLVHGEPERSDMCARARSQSGGRALLTQ